MIRAWREPADVPELSAANEAAARLEAVEARRAVLPRFDLRSWLLGLTRLIDHQKCPNFRVWSARTEMSLQAVNDLLGIFFISVFYP